MNNTIDRNEIVPQNFEWIIIFSEFENRIVYKICARPS